MLRPYQHYNSVVVQSFHYFHIQLLIRRKKHVKSSSNVLVEMIPMRSALRPNGSRQLILIGVIGVSLLTNVDDAREAISRYLRVVAISPPRYKRICLSSSSSDVFRLFGRLGKQAKERTLLISCIIHFCLVKLIEICSFFPHRSSFCEQNECRSVLLLMPFRIDFYLQNFFLSNKISMDNISLPEGISELR